MTRQRLVETSAEESARIAAEVATWPRLTPERAAELRRIFMPAIERSAKQSRRSA